MSSTPPPILPAKTRMTGASITVLILAWLLWMLLILSYSTDLLIAWVGQDSKPPSEPQAAHNDLAAAFAVCSGFQLLVIGFIRWLGLHFLITPRRLIPGTWPAAIVALLATALILGLIKSIEIYGMVLWFGTLSWWHYLPFYVFSLLVFLAHMPCFLLTGRVLHRPLPVTTAPASA